MTFGPFEIFLLMVAAALILFLLLWARDAVSRWWARRHIRKDVRRSSNPGFSRRK